MDEGYIKFRAIWEQTAPFSGLSVSELIHWRQACHDKGWIGMYENGIGFGNISLRYDDTTQFLITGSATGGVQQLDHTHIAKVTRVATTENTLWCEGPLVASSESMSHAAIYEELPWVNGVIHIHHLKFWQAALHQLPTTAAHAPYGSPEMVESIVELLKTTALPQSKVFVMEGHEEGLFAFGHDLEEAFEVLEKAFAKFLA